MSEKQARQSGKDAAPLPLDPLLVAMLDTLRAIGPKWDLPTSARWHDLFGSAVLMLYPPREKRVRRKKNPPAAE